MYNVIMLEGTWNDFHVILHHFSYHWKSYVYHTYQGNPAIQNYRNKDQIMSFIYLFIYLFVYLFIYLFIYF